jgi:hypothetical protein
MGLAAEKEGPKRPVHNLRLTHALRLRLFLDPLDPLDRHMPRLAAGLPGATRVHPAQLAGAPLRRHFQQVRGDRPQLGRRLWSRMAPDEPRRKGLQAWRERTPVRFRTSAAWDPRATPAPAP